MIKIKQEYFEFVEKFKPKKTTDDCYTPPTVYNAVADWVANEYNVDKGSFIRPFYPGGDYRSEDYDGKIVVDNPPFSILAEILSFYNQWRIPCFLFAPTLTLFSTAPLNAYTYLPTGVAVVYENGAEVNTSFITNLAPHEILIDCAPTLHAAVKAEVERIRKEKRKELPKLIYDKHVISSASLQPFSRLGIDLKIRRDGAEFIRSLNCQRKKGKSIFGGGFLLSERESAECERAKRERAKRERAEILKLSEREKQIIMLLDKRQESNGERT